MIIDRNSSKENIDSIIKNHRNYELVGEASSPMDNFLKEKTVSTFNNLVLIKNDWKAVYNKNLNAAYRINPTSIVGGKRLNIDNVELKRHWFKWVEEKCINAENFSLLKKEDVIGPLDEVLFIHDNLLKELVFKCNVEKAPLKLNHFYAITSVLDNNQDYIYVTCLGSESFYLREGNFNTMFSLRLEYLLDYTSIYGLIDNTNVLKYHDYIKLCNKYNMSKSIIKKIVKTLNRNYSKSGINILFKNEYYCKSSLELFVQQFKTLING